MKKRRKFLCLFLVVFFVCKISIAQKKQSLPLNFKIFSVIDFGAIGDSITINTKAIQRTIDTVAKTGGGIVLFPPGNYLTGTIRLRDNITLYLENGSTIWGSNKMSDYEKGQEHLLYAENAKNIAIRGDGRIDGNGPRFWDNGRLQRWYRGEADLPRTSDMLRFDRCTNIVLENVDVYNGAFWNIGFSNCNRVTIHAITMRNGVYEDDGPNTDGINLWNCTKVQISDCDIITGDDCIVVLGESHDVTITNCKLQTSETALMISGVKNLAVSNITIHDSGCGIGFRIWNGILVDGVVINNVVMDVSDRFKGGGTAIYLWSFPEYTETIMPRDTLLPPPGQVKNVTVSNVIASANGLVTIIGDKESYISNLTLSNIKFFMFGGKVSYMNDNPPYPYPIYGFHDSSPYSLFFRFVNNLKLRDIQIEWQSPEKSEWGSALRCWNVNDLEIEGFTGRQSNGSDKPAIWLKDVKGAYIHNCRPPKGTGTFVKLDSGTADVSLMGNDLSQSEKMYSIYPGIKKKSIFVSHNRKPGR